MTTTAAPRSGDSPLTGDQTKMAVRLPRFSVRHLMVVVALAAACFAWLVRTIQDARRNVSSAQCAGHFTQIMCALQNYHQANGCFPPAYVADSEGRPMHSWRVLILPNMEQYSLYNAYHFDEPWDGPNNRKLADLMPSCYACPNGPNYRGQSNRTDYLAIVGPSTAFPGAGSTCMSDVAFGHSDAIMVAEVADPGIHWMEPRDLDVRTMSFVINDRSRPSISSRDPRGARVLCVDTSRIVLGPDTPPSTVKSMTRIRE